MYFTTLLLFARKFAASRRAMLAVVPTLCALLLCVPAFSQSGAGTIQGTVFDQTGAAIAGATVTVIDPARGISRPFTADSAGAYVALDLTPGTYTVRGEFKGFQTVEHANVLVEVGNNIRVDLTLSPGAQTQTVTVTSEAPAVNTTDATLGGTVSNAVLNSLPLNGRNFQRLLELRPGVVTSVGGSSGTSSTNGLRTGDDLQLVDGIAAFAASTGNSVLNSGYRAGDSTSLLPIDAIQEFNTAQNPKAEFGWKAGSIVNIGLKSGTNTLHGTAYAFGRETSLDAGNQFTGVRTPLELEQFGATAGGPIIKNKLFWFAGYEGLHWLAGVTTLSTIPEDKVDATDKSNVNSMLNACDFLASKAAIGKGLAATGGMPGGYNAIGVSGLNGVVNGLSALLSGVTIDPVAGCSVTAGSNAVENLFPFNPTTNTNYNPNLESTSPGNNGIFKGTYHISDHNEVSGMFFRAQQNEQVAGAVSPVWGTFVPAQTQAFDGLWTWTPNSTWVNEFRGGLAYLNNQTLATDANVNPASAWPAGYGIPTGIDLTKFPLYGGAPEIQISPFSFLGSGPKTSVRGPEGSIDLVEHLSYLRGKHAFKFGFEYLDAIFDGNTYNQGNGDVSFGTLQTFLSGNVDGGGVVLQGNPKINARSHNYALFAQDDWRIKTRLTVNLGLRWTYTSPFSERSNYLGNFNPNVNPATTPAIEQAGPGAPLPQMYSADWKAFSPRLGIAWDVQGNGKTVVRLGGSIVYGLLGGGDIVNTMPFGANYPTVNTAANPAGIQTSGTDINIHTANLALLNTNQVNWNTAGPVFPGLPLTYNGHLYSGVTCLPSSAAITVNGVAGNGVPCSANVTTPNFLPDTPVGEWNLDIQRAITNNLTIDVAYVGNHSWDIPSQEMDVNQPLIGTGWNVGVNAGTGGMTPAAWCLASAGDATPYDHCLGKASTGKVGGVAASTLVTNALLANEAAGAPFASKFPYLSYIDQTGNAYHSNYNGLQVTVTMRASHGLNFIAGYTWAHAMDNVSGEGSTAGPQDVYNPRVNYGNSSNDIRNRFTFSTSYNVPTIKAPAQLLQGWSINAIVNARGGSPWWASDSTNDFSGTGEVFAASSSNATSVPFSWNYTGPASAFQAGPQGIPCFGLLSKCTSATIPQACITAAQAPYVGNANLQALALAALDNNGCYMQNGGILTPPAYGTLGDMPRNLFRGQPYYNVDFSVIKDWKFRERFGVQFRGEIFNLFNFADYSNPTGSSLSPTGGGAKFGLINATPNSGNPVLGSGGPRVIQFGLKLSF